MDMSNLRDKKDLLLAFLCVFLVFIAVLYSLPVMPIDETRYMSVAWEMWCSKSFLVPILNGSPYSHKPPLYFWLIHLGWWIFGVSPTVARLIPFLFSLGVLFLTYKISKFLWKQEQEPAFFSPLILSSMWMFLLWSSLIMFDMILTFWVVLGIYGMLITTYSKRGWLFLWIALSLGGLTKGPVILVHIVPIAIFYFWILGKRVQVKWYLLFGAIVAVSFCTDLLWVLSAMKKAGKLYEEQILWGQTAHRIVSSFAHKRPIWWYLYFLPLILFPWGYLIHKWKGFSVEDKGIKLSLVWVLGAFLTFSLISGKQVYYILPELPGISILIAKAISREKKIKTYILGVFYFLLAIILILIPFIRSIPKIHLNMRWVVVPLILIIFSLFFIRCKFKDSFSMARTVAISITIVLCLFFIISKDFFHTFDLSYASKIVASKIKKGKEVVFIGKYHGQMHFLGRIKKRFFIFRRWDGKDLKKFITHHPNCIIISQFRIRKFKRHIPEQFIYYKQRVRGRILIIWKRQGFIKMMLQRG